jgi:transcriptional regulator with XRE-family HTH domain
MELKVFDITHFLNRKGWIQADLAKKIGCSTSNVGMWASGTSPGFDKLVKLVELGMSVEEIFGSKLYKKFILQDLEQSKEVEKEAEIDFENRVCKALIKCLSKISSN